MLRPSLWVSLVPYGIGRTKPNQYLEILRTVWDNRHDLPYAWRILSRGVCDGCALGVAGFRDWTMEGVHLCTTRLDLLTDRGRVATSASAAGQRDPVSGVPDYNAVVEITRA